MIIKIAWRNVWRNKLRSLVVIFSIAVGLTASAFYAAFSWGMTDKYVENSISGNLSHIQVHHADFKRTDPNRLFIEGGPEMVTKIAQNELVEGVSGRYLIGGMASSSRAGAGAMIHGINPADEDVTTGLSSKLIEGKYFEGVKRNPIIIGQKLAEKLKIGLRNGLTLTFENEEREYVQVKFKVVGIYKSGNTALDEVNVYVRSEDLLSEMGSAPKINEIAVLLRDNNDLDAATTNIKAIAGGQKVETWKEYASELNYMISMLQQYMYIFTMIILLALLFGIVNTMLMAVLERVRELGMLMSVGLNKTKLFMMIVLETVFLAIVGGPLGVLISYALVTYYGNNGIDLSFFSQAFESLGISSVIHPSLTWTYYLEITLMAIAATIIAAIYPARKALQLNPSEAIRKI